MFRRPLVPILLALALLGAGIAIGAGLHGDWGRHGNAVAVTTVGGDAAHPGQTIVVADGGWHHGFFPFGFLFFPLVVLLVLALARRGRGGCGPWRGGGPGQGPGAGPGGTPTAV